MLLYVVTVMLLLLESYYQSPNHPSDSYISPSRPLRSLPSHAATPVLISTASSLKQLACLRLCHSYTQTWRQPVCVWYHWKEVTLSSFCSCHQWPRYWPGQWCWQESHSGGCRTADPSPGNCRSSDRVCRYTCGTQRNVILTYTAG